MKLQTLTLSFLACTGLAKPVRRDASQAIYALRLSSSVPSLNGLYLTRSPNNRTILGIFPHPNDNNENNNNNNNNNKILFYPVHDPKSGLSELRTPASGDTLAVLGFNGLLDLASLADPAAVDLAEGTTCDWTSFRLEPDHERKSGAAETGTVMYAGEGSEGRWVAFPAAGDPGAGGGWYVKWKDVNAWTMADYMPVQLEYQLAEGK
ncbi:hypothetical protein N658DRAFT_492094 [Parathielavia hyrcaniae]|uniref:Uncharacterized protein n=1 Tax=Parathielavia hyrcaniae TaxID=113614 RepID=A0AAN6Q8P6_9PEZI|nr:hypothetical protein N658DRAFT_492094 [Parathielavia hyrcaniae]